jgi:hypothetical protein
MGVKPDSPFADLFLQFYKDVVTSVETEVDFKTRHNRIDPKQYFHRHDRLSDHMMVKIKEAQEKGLKVYYGSLDSETSPIQTFFCTDAIEVENEKIYFNGLENVW